MVAAAWARLALALLVLWVTLAYDPDNTLALHDHAVGATLLD
jgi:hypothetical protein